MGKFTNSAKDIAKFLHKYDLDKAKLGEYLSDNEPNRAEILYNFISIVGFSKFMDFDLALRKFLYGFRLPGEAQKIDRLMKGFSSYFYDLHKDEAYKYFSDSSIFFLLFFLSLP